MNLIYNYIFPGEYAPGYICKSKIYIFIKLTNQLCPIFFLVFKISLWTLNWKYAYEKNKGTKSDNNLNVILWIHTLFRHLMVKSFI